MASPRFRLALAGAVILGLTACASTEPAASGEATSEAPAASLAAPSSAPAEAVPAGPSPLDSIPEEPYGYSTGELQSVMTGQAVAVDVEGGPLTYAASNQMAPAAAESGTDFSGALKAAFQLDWVGAQRDTIFNGWRMENIRGNVDDVKHFVAPSNMNSFLPDAEKSLKAAEEREKDGAATTPAQDYYVLHVGQMAQEDFSITDEQKAAWPGHQDSVVWMKFRGEGQPDQIIPIPRDAKATYSTPVVTSLQTLDADNIAGSIQVTYTSTATVAMADGRSTRMALERKTSLVLEGGTWMVTGSYGQILQTGIV